jgi:hypothetical protein
VAVAALFSLEDIPDFIEDDLIIFLESKELFRGPPSVLGIYVPNLFGWDGFRFIKIARFMLNY